MANDRQVPSEHADRIALIRQHIRDHMGEPLPRKQLAALTGFSEVHFHRIFTAYVGESLTQYVRRVRLERAARQLLDQRASITDIALASGYGSHSAFGKAFREFFHLTPSEFREFYPVVATHIISRRIPFNREEIPMEPKEIATFPEVFVLYARATETLTTPAFCHAPAEAFGKLHAFVEKTGLMAETRRWLAIYPDRAETDTTLRFDAGVVFKEGVRPEVSGEVAYQTIAAGRWAIFTHVGPYDMLWKSWQSIYRDWLPTSGEDLRDIPGYEDYIDDPDKVQSEQLRTDLYVPLR